MSLPTKEGHLYKYRNFVRKWAYRYFKLNKTYLHYYESPHSLHPIESIVRTDITSVDACSSFSDRDYVLTVCSKSHDKWHLAASDEAEMKEWSEDLRAHLPSFKESSAQPEKLPLKDDDDYPPSPTVTAPPLPRYMAAQMLLQQDFPPSYEAACAPKPSTTPADMTHES